MDSICDGKDVEVSSTFFVSAYKNINKHLMLLIILIYKRRRVRCQTLCKHYIFLKEKELIIRTLNIFIIITNKKVKFLY